MTATERILQFLESENISKREFYANTGLSNGFLDKTSNPGSDKLERIISAYPKLSLTWVVTGRGEMEVYAINGINEKEQSYNVYPDGQVPEPRPDRMSYSIHPSSQKGTKSTKSVSPTVRPTNKNTVYLTPQFITVDNQGRENILHISIKAAAGYLRGYSDKEYLERQPSFNLPGLTDATYRSFEVDGDSMFPTLKHQQMVIGRWVEKLDYIREDHVYIIVHKTLGVIIKRVLNRIEKRNKIVCKSDATNDRELYKTFEIDPDEVQELWFAVFHGGFDFQSPSDMWKRVNNHEADITNLRSTVDQLVNVIKTAGLIGG